MRETWLIHIRVSDRETWLIHIRVSDRETWLIHIRVSDRETWLIHIRVSDRETWLIHIRVSDVTYDRCHWICYTPEILQTQNLKLLSTNSNRSKIWIRICTARYRGIWVLRSGGFWGCWIFSGNCHNILWDATLSTHVCVTWLIYMCDMTHLYVRHDSLICETWLIHSVTWLIHIRVSDVTWILVKCDVKHSCVWDMTHS